MSERNKEGVPLRSPPLHGAPHPGLEASHALHGQAQADLLPLPEAIPDDVNVRHISILLDGDTPNINNITNSELFHCPFCKYVGAKYKVDYHVQGHSSVKHKEFTIIKCGLSCRTATHFHCCYCAATLRNRLQLVRHLEIHQEEVQAAAPAQHFVAPAQLPVAPTQLPVAPAQLPVAPAQLPVAPPQHPLAPAECSTATKASKKPETTESSVPSPIRRVGQHPVFRWRIRPEKPKTTESSVSSPIRRVGQHPVFRSRIRPESLKRRPDNDTTKEFLSAMSECHMQWLEKETEQRRGEWEREAELRREEMKQEMTLRREEAEREEKLRREEMEARSKDTAQLTSCLMQIAKIIAKDPAIS